MYGRTAYTQVQTHVQTQKQTQDSDMEIIKYLIDECKINPLIIDHYGTTYLMRALDNPFIKFEYIEYLVGKNINVSHKSKYSKSFCFLDLMKKVHLIILRF